MAVPDGVNSVTVTAPVLPFTLVTAQLSAAHSYQSAVFFITYPVVAVPHGVNSLTVTAHVLPFTLVTHPVGARISFQLAAVEYGATLSTYVLFSDVTIAMSH